MDWRNRNYYLVRLCVSSRDMRMEYFKTAAPSMKMHSPYNHFKSNENNNFDHDGKYSKITGVHIPEMMISCKKADAEALEYELRKAVRRDDNCSNFYKLSKEICGQ